MEEQDKVNLREKWEKWIDKMRHDLSVLLISQDIIKELSQIVASNKRIQSSPFLFKRIQDNYIDSVVVGIGRLYDDDDRAISLHNLIEEIIKNPEVITRDYFVSRYPKFMQEKGAADADFDKFADTNEQFINENKLRADQVLLKDKTRLIRGLRDKWVAHLDENRPLKQLATHGDVENALSALDRILCKYYILIKGLGMPTAKSVLAFNWKESLMYPWIDYQD